MNVALIGGRRMGKTSASSDIIERTAKHWDLVIAFIGSAACNPVLETQMRVHKWDPRFFFSEYKESFIVRLLAQQEALKAAGTPRHCLVLVDDVVLQGSAKDSLANLGIRGRHFNISIIMCCVSYTTIPKRLRRSLDCVLVYSCPMSGDLQTLSWEFTSRAKMARFTLQNLKEYQCLVLETLSRTQELFVWRSRLVTIASHSPENDQSRERRAHAARNTSESSGSPAVDPGGPRQSQTSSSHCCIQSPEADFADDEASL